MACLSHIKRQTNDDRFPLPLGRLGSDTTSVYQSRLGLDLLNSVHATLFIMIHMGTIYRHAKLNQRLYRLTTGSFIGWVRCSVLWVTKLRSIRSLLQLAKYGVILR